MLKLLDISKTCYKIQRITSYNLLINKEAGKVPLTIYRLNEKSYKSTGKLEVNLA